MEAKKLENYSYEDYLQIDKTTKERVELIFGKIYMMAGASAKHQDIVLNIAMLIKALNKCKPRVAPYDLKLICDFGGKDSINIVQPDIMIFCEDKDIPCAIFEVLSPSTAQKDKKEKFSLYECTGIKEYYIVEPEYKSVEKFVLENGKYKFGGNYVLKDKMFIDCIEQEIEIEEFFVGVEE